MRLQDVTGLALMAALGLAGCATTKTASDATPAATPAEDQAMVELMDHHAHHHRGGLLQFVAMSLDTLGVDEARTAQVDRLQAGLYACMAPAGEVQKKLHLQLADGIAAGAIDAAQVDATIKQLGTAAAERECGAPMLDQLHAVLSPPERSELAEKVQAHWAVWQAANQEAQEAGQGGGRLARLAREVNLTPVQIDEIAVALRAPIAAHSGSFDRAKLEAHVQAFATTFVGDPFDARSITAHGNDRFATHGAMRMAVFYEIATPFLAPAQRATLAEHMRRHAANHPNLSSN